MLLPAPCAPGSELVQLASDATGLCVGAACSPEKHPESTDADADVRAAVEKVRAGASFLISQIIFDNRVYFDFVAGLRAAGVAVPVLPGIMPITNVDQVGTLHVEDGCLVPDGTAHGAP